MGYSKSNKIDICINNDILNVLCKENNIILYELSNSDKTCIIFLLKQYYLELRTKLGISEDITFGLEIEFEEAFRDIIEEKLGNNFSSGVWSVVDDGTLSNGGEINSPKLTDNEKIWIDLSYVCNIVNNNAYVMDNTSAHIHIGTQILGNNPKYWGNFAMLWATYENIIFRFLYGEYVSPRSCIEEYAMPISSDLISKLDKIKERTKNINASYMFKLLDNGDESIKIRRRKSVNFTNVSDLYPYMYDRNIDMNTIEFRSANGTFNPIIWQNNINLIIKMLLYCKSNKFDEDKIFKRLSKIVKGNIPSELSKYSYIYIEQAIEFADMIFDNNLDKIYFLRQYIKDGSVSNKPLVKSKNFTRR